jgi:hypothetical protein
MNDKPRIGRPPYDDGFLNFTIVIRATEAERDAILDGLPTRERTEAMLAAIDAREGKE